MAPGKTTAEHRKAVIVLSDESGLSLLPPVRRTWAPAGQTPTSEMRTGQRPKVSVVGWCCYSLGQPARYFYRVVPGSVTDRILIRQLRQVHRSLGRPIVLIWDNLSSRRSRRMRVRRPQPLAEVLPRCGGKPISRRWTWRPPPRCSWPATATPSSSPWGGTPAPALTRSPGTSPSVSPPPDGSADASRSLRCRACLCPAQRHPPDGCRARRAASRADTDRQLIDSHWSGHCSGPA